MYIHEDCEITGMEDVELELLMPGGDDQDLEIRCNDDAYLAASLQPMALA